MPCVAKDTLGHNGAGWKVPGVIDGPFMSVCAWICFPSLSMAAVRAPWYLPTDALP